MERTARLNLRLTPELDAVLRAAAARRHKSLSAFVLDAAYDAAVATLAAPAPVLPPTAPPVAAPSARPATHVDV